MRESRFAWTMRPRRYVLPRVLHRHILAPDGRGGLRVLPRYGPKFGRRFHRHYPKKSRV